MNEQEIKARFSNIIGELPQIQKGKAGTNTGTANGQTTYNTTGELIAELANLTYSRNVVKSPLYQAIDELRLREMLQRTDPKLSEDFTPQEKQQPLAKAITNGRFYRDKNAEQAKKANELIREMRKDIVKNPNTYTVSKWTRELAQFLAEEEKSHENSIAYREEINEKAEPKDSKQRAKVNMERYTERTYKTKEKDRLEPKIRIQVFNELRKIIKNRENQRRENTTKGKIRAQRLGHYPSPYIFSKKQQPQPILDIHLLIDLSGSMAGDKIKTAIQIKNELQLWNKTNKRLHFIMNGFNAEYYTEEEIGNNQQHAEYLMNMPKNKSSGPAGHNADGYYLKLKMQEIQQSKNETALIILSDGQPAPTYCTNKPTLKVQAQKLEQSKIPYKSIGLYSHTVAEYYKHYAVLNNIEDLPKIIAETVRHFIARV